MEFKEVRGFANALKGDKVLIESDWNLKWLSRCAVFLFRQGINRIRLEFKGARPTAIEINHKSINRIRLEFKGRPGPAGTMEGTVLIESDWNLKQNNKEIADIVAELVLIESDWNLKGVYHGIGQGDRASINRIRLEFKGDCPFHRFSFQQRINRIRLEFKVDKIDGIFDIWESINRIRLEFKVKHT